MPENRIVVWVQRFNDRAALMLQWIDPDTGKRKSQSAKTNNEKIAERKRADLESDLNNGRYAETSRMTWERFRELFEAEYVAPCRRNTRMNYQATLDLFERLCNPRNIRSITQRTISAFAAGMRQVKVRGRVGMMPSSIKVRLQFLHTALSWAVEQGLLPKVPNFPAVKVPKKKPQPIPAESFEKLLEKAPDANMKAYLLTGWLAGLRLAEAACLEWKPSEDVPHLDLARNRIILPAAFAKADEDQWVPIDPALRTMLESLPRHGKKVFRFEAKDGHAISFSAISDRVSDLAKQAGVKLTMHSLRKGFGCRYAGKVPAQVLQRLMRHASIKTTMDYYANVDEAVENAILGNQRNTLRNTGPEKPSPDNHPTDRQSSET